MVITKPRLTSQVAKDKGKRCLVDRISELPADILVSILSLLALKEAAATSILSSRWRYLWASSVNLIFPFRFGYIDWVNSVVQQYRGSHIKHFSVCFDPGSLMFKRSIMKWIQLAEKKGAQRLELIFFKVGGKIEVSYASPQYIETGMMNLMMN
ncbi:hypothetical protein ACLB2K_042555 [Fragaria x ananassa]